MIFHRASCFNLRKFSLITLCVVSCVAASACSSDKPKTKPTSSSSSSTIAPGAPSVQEHYAYQATQLVTSGTPPRRDAALERRLRAVGQKYIHGAMWTPLATHRSDATLASLFNTGAAKRLTAGGNDQRVLSDPANGLTVADLTATIGLHILTDPAGAPVSASLTISATAKGTSMVERYGELLLVPEGSKWRIAGYDLTVTRSFGSGDRTTAATTTAKSTP